MAILRSLGAGPTTILGLLITEGVLMAIVGSILGFALLYLGLWVAQPMLDAGFGLFIPITLPAARDIYVVAGIIGAAAVVSFVPAVWAYRKSITDGMMVKM